MKNWKTTVFGAVAAVFEGGPEIAKLLSGDVVNWKNVGFAVALLIWGYFQKDKNVTGVR